MSIEQPTTVEELEALLNSEDDTPCIIRPDGSIATLRAAQGPMTRREWPDPTPEMLADPKFEVVWQTIRSWDINVPDAYNGYMGATGNHVRAILDALKVIQ